MSEQIEQIPDNALLYRRIHHNLMKRNGQVARAAFDLHPQYGETSLSVDWAEHATPEETRGRDGRDPRCFGVVSLLAAKVRNLGEGLPELSVRHDPILNDPKLEDNYAHSLIEGDLNLAVRTEVRDSCTWRLHPEP